MASAAHRCAAEHRLRITAVEYEKIVMGKDGNHYLGDRLLTEEVSTSCWFSWTLDSYGIKFRHRPLGVRVSE
jgi:hypothetical protein